MTKDLETATITTPGGAQVEVGIVSRKYPITRLDGRMVSVPIYDERAIGWIAEYIKERVRHRFDCPVLITGQRRTGKSTVGIKLARTIDPDFSANNLSFRLADFNKTLHDNSPANPDNDWYPQAFLDEAGFDLFSQNWVELVQKNLVKKFEVIGAKNQVVYLVLPHRMLLNKAMREFMCHLWLTTRTIQGERGIVEVRESSENIWKLEAWWSPKMAITFGPESGPFWNDYTKRKMDFINEVTGAEEAEPEVSIPRALDQRNKLLKLIRTDRETLAKMTIEQIAQAIGLTKDAVFKATR